MGGGVKETIEWWVSMKRMEPHGRVETSVGRVVIWKVMVPGIVLRREKAMWAKGDQVTGYAKGGKGAIRKIDSPLDQSHGSNGCSTIGRGNGAPRVIYWFGKKVVGYTGLERKLLVEKSNGKTAARVQDNGDGGVESVARKVRGIIGEEVWRSKWIGDRER
jgi:hypothetical protein